MRGACATMKVLRPRSAKEALRELGRNPRAIPLAGATDFMCSWNAGLLNKKTMLDLSRLKEWTHIHKLSGGLRIGVVRPG